jgi:protein SCO1/2
MLAGIGALALLQGRARARESALPGDSVYQLQAPLIDQQGHRLELGAGRGSPVLVSMFYTSCPIACPLTFETIHLTLAALPPEAARRVRVLLITMDPDRDTVQVLGGVARERGCDERWTLARPQEEDVRPIAAILGIQVRRLPSGDFNHSTLIDLLDRQGRIVARSSRLGEADPALLDALRRQLSPVP